MVELNGVRIWGVGFEGGRPLPPRKLPCGTLARPRGDAGRMGGAGTTPDRIGVPGRPDLAVARTGWFELVATGEVLAVYGAVVEPVGGPAGGEARGDAGPARL